MFIYIIKMELKRYFNKFILIILIIIVLKFIYKIIGNEISNKNFNLSDFEQLKDLKFKYMTNLQLYLNNTSKNKLTDYSNELDLYTNKIINFKINYEKEDYKYNKSVNIFLVICKNYSYY